MGKKSIAFSVDSRDIRFTLFEVARIQELLRFERFAHLRLEKMQEILAQTERFAVEEVAPLNRLADSSPPQYRDGKVLMPAPYHAAFKKYCAAGWIPLTLEKEARGWGVPESLAMATKEILNGACGGFYVFPSTAFGALHLIESFGTEELKRLFVDKMCQGIFGGTMCLTEPHAGSYLADITASAKRQGDIFSIQGMKIFIGAGEHDLTENIVHCVLARIEGAPPGYKGISLFAVPKYRLNADGTLGPSNDVYCSRIENKMGHNGAPTATLQFGNNGDCHGWLIGQEGEGLAHMFQMMNEMRLNTAVQALGQAAAAYRIALSYAQERIQGLSYKRKKGDPMNQVSIIQHPDVRRNLLFMKTIVEGCRALIYQTAFYLDLSRAMEKEEEREHYLDLVEILTPLCKSYATDMGFKVTETAIQTMGGVGYMKEYGVEQYLRDIKPASIYEGANGIHAIDLQRRKLSLKKGTLFKSLIGEIESFSRENISHPTLGPAVKNLEKAKETMIEAAKSFPAKNDEDPGLPLSVAKPFLDLVGHVLCTWMLLKSGVVADSLMKNAGNSEKQLAFYRGKLHAARFAASNLLPQVDALAKTISAWDRSILDIGEGEF